MVKVHKIKLYPTNSQEVLFRKSCGVARFAYNWALNRYIEDYNKEGIKHSAYGLIKYLNSIKRKEFPWMQDTSKNCSQYAIHNVERAYKNMWKHGAKYPKFKKKGQKDSFIAVENKEQFKQKDFKIRLPRIGWVKCAENLRFEGKVNYVAVKRTADIWFAYVNVEVTPTEIPIINESQVVVGIDVGIKSLMVLSDGIIFKNPEAGSVNSKSLKRLQRSVSRKLDGSNNKKKARIKVARKHYRISCIRSNAIHQATSYIVKNYDKIVIETLKPVKMLKSSTLSKSLSDASFGEIARQLTYKAHWYGKELVKADQWFASSKICSGCGNKKKVLSLGERTYNCECCGLKIGRDLNAAKNLAKYRPTGKTSGCEAFGEGSSSAVMLNSPSVNEELINKNCLRFKN